jgi:hypothetical protein
MDEDATQPSASHGDCNTETAATAVHMLSNYKPIVADSTRHSTRHREQHKALALGTQQATDTCRRLQ